MANSTKGDGSIKPMVRNGKEVKNCWRITLSFGFDKNGKRNRITRVVHGSKTDARKVRDKLLQEYGNISFDTKDITFAEYIDTWEISMRTAGSASEETLKGYLRKLGLMKEFLGDKKLIEIKADDIEAALAGLRKQGKSGSTLNQVFAYTKRVFELALDRDIILRNPCNKVATPKAEEPERHALSAQECALFHQRLNERECEYRAELGRKEDRVESRTEKKGRALVRGLSDLSSIMAIRIELATGMRRGEVCGLLWECVDIPNQKITVKRSLTPQMHLKVTKTKAGMRTISIDSEIAGRLATWKQLQLEMVESIYGPGSEKCRNWQALPVCCSDKGDLLDPTNFQRWWQAFRKEIGFPNLQMHELRHTQATQLLGNNVDVKTVAARLGHKKASTTLNIYSHAIPENDESAADLIGSIINGASNAAGFRVVKSA